MPRFLALSFALCLLIGATASANVNATYEIKLPDGSDGMAPFECGVGDLCATLTSSDGSRLEMYNEGAPRCQPFGIRMVKMRGNVKLFSYNAHTNLTVNTTGIGPACGFGNAVLTLDDGRIRLNFGINHDGTLSARWQATDGVQAISIVHGRPQVGDEAAPDPMLIDADYSRQLQDGHPVSCHANDQQWARWTTSFCHNYRVEYYRERAEVDPFDSPSPLAPAPAPTP